jgi:hypothetical protein
MVAAYELEPPLVVDAGVGPELAGRQVNERLIAFVVMVLAGALVAMQAPINSALGRAVGSFQARRGRSRWA